MHPALRLFAWAVLALVVFFFALAGIATAHEFYERWCCDGKDCKPYLGKVEVTPKGYYIPEFDQLIPFKDALGKQEYAETAGTRYAVPENGPEYSMCKLPYENKIRCFYAKPGGV